MTLFTNADLVAVVRTYANAHYNEGGWDYLVECWEGGLVPPRVSR